MNIRSGNVGAAALQILISRLEGVADEMGAVLRRAAYSPNIKERADCSAALFTADGTMLVQAEHIPVHLGSMPAAVRAAIDACGSRLRPGDQVMVNDPFAGGTHLNDVTLVAPTFAASGALVGWAANRAHHADLGGMAPGSMPPNATEIYQEGLRVPPVLCTPEVEAIFVTSSRTPEERRGDLDAQRGANRLGVDRLLELDGEPFDEVVAYGERRMRAALQEIPDGRYEFEDVLDSTGGPDSDREGSATGAARIAVVVTVAGDTVTFDFTGTDAQRPGTVNAPRAVTTSAVAFAIRSVTDPTIPANGGALRPVRVLAPAGLGRRSPPARRGRRGKRRGQPAHRRRLPRRARPRRSRSRRCRVAGDDEQRARRRPVFRVLRDDRWRSGWPAGPSARHERCAHRDDQHARHAGRSARARIPDAGQAVRVEIWFGWRRRRAGGEGIERELEMLEEVTVSLITERRASRPWGLAGGDPGACGENWLLRAGDESRAEPLPDKCTVHLAPGDVLRVRTPGGGGWGRP